MICLFGIAEIPLRCKAHGDDGDDAHRRPHNEALWLRRVKLENFFEKASAVQLLHELIDGGIQPIVYAFIGGEEKFSYRRMR